MFPAGEMWSVVTLSPTITSTRAPLIGWIGDGCGARSVKNGGSWMYVLLGSHSNSSPPLIGMAFHCSFFSPTLAYCFLNMTASMHDAIVLFTSACVGQRSLR